LEFLLFLIGFALAAATLRDVFDTVVVPGASRARLHVTRRLVFVLLPVWRRLRSPRRGLSTTFAPLMLVLSFSAWMLLLAVAFGLMAYALRGGFNPPLNSFAQAVFVAGSALTIGLSETDANGLARWVILGAGFCGLSVMTMAVTYLLVVQNGISRRDAGILKFRTSAGDPPSPVALLEKYAVLGLRAELPLVLREAREWCVAVRQSHSSHPSLIYFRSIGTGSGWPAALGALLDLALIIELLLDEPQGRGPAVLLREEGTGMLKDLTTLLGLDRKPRGTSPEELDIMIRRLSRAGYRMRAPHDRERFARMRDQYDQCVTAMAEHLGTPATQILPER
jgi:hypothetical protein